MNTNRKRRMMRGRPWQVLGLLMLFAWLVPQGVAARDLICDVASNYMVMLNGATTVKIQVPVYDEDSYDTWVEDGYLKYEIQDPKTGNLSDETTLFRWYKDENNHDNDDEDLWCKMSTGAGGSIEVTQGNSNKHFTLSGSGERRELIYERTSDHTYTIYAVWTVPYNMRGKTLRFKWSVMRNGTSSRKRYEISIDPTTITIPEPEGIVQPQVSAASLSMEEKGKLELPWFVASTKVQKVVAKYKTPDGSDWVSQTLTTDQSGTLHLSATEPHDAFRIIVDYKDNQNYLIEGVESAVQNLGMIHAPFNFRASPQGGLKAPVQLHWDILYPDHEDLTPFDVFEIQRSLTGEEADFTTIGVETLDLDTHHYTYTDSTLIEAISEAHLKNGGTLEKLTYRIRRMATQNWGWEGNTTASTASCVIDDLHLQRIANYTAEWEDKQAYTVKVNWDYANEYNAVWDNRAKMMLRVVSVNRAGQPVDTTLYTLTASEMEARYKIVTLQRPCVKYDIKMYIERATSPIHTWDDITPYFFSIRSAADWQTFRDKVNNAKGQSDVNARLYADISTDLCVGLTDGARFRGTFDGNGHTVDFNINTSGSRLALFHSVDNATIRNLHVKGSVTASEKFASGLIGDVRSNSTVYIENCRSSVTITSSVNGDASNGGLVALVNSGANVTIRNCQFDGSFEGANCHSNGGFVGWPTGTVLIENSLFSPTHVGTMHNNCATYSRNDSWVTLKNCHATQEYIDNLIVISNTNDWNFFCSMVKSAAGNYDVDAVLNADIIVTSTNTSGYYAGMDAYPYRGTFNGNGHSMSVDINWGTNYYAAPFPAVNKATIKNLKVGGRVLGGTHSAGLIGHAWGPSPSITIKNLYISTYVSTEGSYAGEVIGHAHSATVEIEDCRPYGFLTANGSNSYGGAVIGWADNADNWEMHRVYEWVRTDNITHLGFSFYNPGTAWGYNSKSTGCASWHDWDEVKEGYRGISASQATAIFNQEKPGAWDTTTEAPVRVDANAFPTADELIASLGTGWKNEGDKAVLNLHSFDENQRSYPTPTLPDFYHESIGKVDKTLMTETRQSSVVLTWETDGNPIDYFQVLRRVKGTANWEVIASDLDQKSYEDKTVSPLVDYEYKVRGTNDCEGVSYSETEVKPGACMHSGKLEGYLRFNDGTAVPGITVEIVSGSVKTTAVSDEKGYYMAEGLSYQGKQSIEYVVTPVAMSGINLEVKSYSVTFDDKSNYQQVHEFTITSGKRFSGYVMYDGTSIPVKGVRFRVNGNLMHNAAGDYVETDFEGKFSFNVLGGNNIIQTVMDGHDFANGGYFKSPNGYVFTDNVAQIYFYDTTKVKLTGRVVGGKDQGNLPLDNNLSRNNLGDDLTMVMTLEGDNTSWLVYDNLNPGLSQRNDTIKHSGGKHKTTVTVQRKRMTVKPDSVTGEYVLMLPPVRWKVQQVYCEGYPTLFQDGQVSEVIDLTECLKPDTLTKTGTFVDVDENSIYRPTEICNARYSRIYHAPVEITYKQLSYDTFDYFGDKSYMASTVDGTKAEVPLAYESEIVTYKDSIIGYKDDIVSYKDSITGYKDVIVGYEEVELEYENPFDIYTHTPTLTGTSASVNNTGRLYSFLFDNNDLTDWEWQVFPNETAWVEFKTDHLVSVSKYIIRTSEGLYAQSSITPRNWRLMGKAKESDEWTTLAEVMDDNIMSYFEVNSYTYNTSNHAFCQFFRFEFTGSVGNQGRQALAGVSFTCRGKANSKPEDDHGGTYTVESAITEKVPVTERVPVFGKVSVTQKVPIYGDKEVHYTFGHPVFSIEKRYPLQLSVVERYPWNNASGTKRVDVVRIGSGKVTVHNGMKNGTNQEVVQLDTLGQGLFYLKADQTTRLLTGEDALHTVTMTLEQDGTTYEAKPLKGYILNMFPTSGATDVLVNGQPLLIDILRDPPGGGSSATLEKGSTLKYNYTMDMTYRAALNLSWTKGTTLENYQGVVAAPEGTGSTYGIINQADTKSVLDFGYGINGEGTRNFTYTMKVEQDISTSDDSHMVGADADLYIGMVQNVIVTPMSTIRAIPDRLYQQMLGKLGGGMMAGVGDKYGTLVHIAEGRDANDSIYHLVRDESLAYGPKVQSQFVHSQKHILSQMVPGLIQQCRALMFTGTAAEAQAKANATGKPVYRSLLGVDNEEFGVLNAKDGKPYYYTSTMPEDTTMNYVIHLPVGTGNTTDEVAEKGQIIMAWLNMIAENEREKLNASDLVANYDIDGGTSVNYSETFESEYSVSNYMHMPGIIKGDYFDNCWTDKLLGIGGMVGIKIANVFIKKLWGKLNKSAQANGEQRDKDNSLFTTKVAFAGKNFEFSILPSLEYDVKDVSSEDNAYSRKESFKLSMHPKSHLNVDVFRAQTDTATVKAASAFDVFTNSNFKSMTDYVEPFLGRDLDLTKLRYPRSFVYRTRGGATCNSWENERRTMFYNEGSILDERTKKIANPKITVDRQSISGVPYGEPARFKVFLTNESEMPEAATGGLVIFSFYLDETSNPKGAKLLVDGMPLTGGGRDVFLYPGEVTQKILEVYAGEDFDYENLIIGINSPDDWVNTSQELSIDVHYLRQAGPVNISLPGDKWIMNTYAEKDDRGWFLPVIIDGFDKHQHNFDHIEFQYKESQRGNDSWTNLCSFYADSLLMKAASGVCEMIPENGNIHTEFYGEGTVMEKAYDLRAVLYCRNGNSFLTTPSKVMSGVKDTRRPQLFGTPEPKDGIIGIGDNIIFNFTEDIEYNYLSAITNFEVKGEVNNQNVSEAVSVQFTGNGSVESEAQRNFSGKDLTIDLMIRPDATGRDMPLFSHGTNGKKLQLWLTSERLLKAIVDDQTFISDTAIVKGFTQVAMSINMEDSVLTFYNGGKTIGQAKLKEAYNGTGRLIFGRTNETDRSKSQYYQGRMMEARVWYRAMTGGQVGTTYGSQRLTGYEMGLVDYYPMNEGTGDYALDKTQGANAQLMGASWAMPRGWSLRLENDGVALTQNALNRTPEQDYTMMFWFKTDDAYGTILSNGSGKADNDGAANQFRIGIDDGTLSFCSNGMTVEAGSGYNDNQWHHYAMSVNRARGVANIYIDQTLRATFSPDSLGGISGGTPFIGGCVREITYDTANVPARAPLAARAPATGNTVNLSTLTANYEAKDGDVLTGTLGANVKISVASRATVTLNGATINGTNSNSYKWAGINCPDDATIILKGTNTVKGFHENYPGIHIAKGKTLTIQGDGSLTATSNGHGAGIGGGYEIACGNIVIEGGTIIATGGKSSAGIGGTYKGSCGTITISGGNITATGGNYGAGIGDGGSYGSCGNITITGGNITATSKDIGAGIGIGFEGSCGNIAITGGTVTATGYSYGAGIGTSYSGSCGDITITDGVIRVTATKGSFASNSIGRGDIYGSVGTVTIDGTVGAISESPYTYAPVHATGVMLNKTSITLPVGSTETLTATVIPDNAKDKSVTWMTSNASVATVADGMVTAIAPGTAIITVTTADGAKTATCTVSVTQPTTGVKLNKTSTMLNVGSSETLTATVFPDNATNKSVTWTTSNANVATVANGTVTAIAVGTATITVTTADGAKTATCTVTVTQPVTGVTLNKVNTTLAVGSTETLTATVIPDNATDKRITWTTSNAAVATVTNGMVTAVSPGIAIITATSSNGQTATCEVTVIQPVTGVTLNKTSTLMNLGSTMTLRATVAPDNATDKRVTWTTSNANVAAVTDGVVTAVASGTATITVTTTDGEKTATCEVTVVSGNLIGDLTGNVDELCMFQQALPPTLIKTYATKSPNGDEAGLLTYLAFDRQERQKDNDIETVAYPWSKKIYLDDKGEVRYELDPVTKQNTSTPVRDYVFVASQDEMLKHITNETAAPVVPYEELHNLKFSFAGKDNQVLVGIDELASRINRRNIYVTVRDVEDKNGNAMASPQTACYYVTNSSLQWMRSFQEETVSYGRGETIYFNINNNTASSHTYTIENCPKWLTLSSYSDVMSPLYLTNIQGTVSKDLNVGTYNEILYLTDEDGVSEPLYLTVVVEAEKPDWSWSVDDNLLKHSMNIAGQVYLNGEIDIDSKDIVGVFDGENRCHGFANINYSALTGESNLYLTVYDSEPNGTELYFKLWQYSTGRELMLTADGSTTLTFRDKAVLGTDTPVRFEGGSLYVQTFNLKEGWNWVSFNVASEKLFNLNTLLDGLPWEEGDVLTDMNSDLTLVYKNGHWLSSEQVSRVRLSPRKAYAIKVQWDIEFPVAGSIIKQLDARTIELKQGWNGIGYTPMLNLSVETALSDYYDKAQPGDVIKSHDEFAYFTVSGGVGRWRGSLEYMKPGEGYMLLRKAESPTAFTYPFYEPGSTFLDEWSYSTVRSAAPARAKTTMSVSAVVEGFELEEGDTIVAFADGETVGVAAAVSGETAEHTEPIYLSIGGEVQQGIWFAIERGGEIVAATSEQMMFTPNAVIGSPDEPTKISFVQTDRTDGKWYDLSGRQIVSRKSSNHKLPSGVYIFNGKKVVVK